MSPTITIFCKNNQQYYDVPRGISLIELQERIGLKTTYPTVAAHVNYKAESLDFLLYKPKDVEFLDASTASGNRCYTRTLNMVLACAVQELYPEADIRIEHPISKGYYCTLQWKQGSEHPSLSDTMVARIKERMQTIIRENRKIEEIERRTQDVVDLFAHRADGKSALFTTLGNPYCRYFQMGDYIDYYSSVLMPSSGYITVFDLVPYYDGMLLRVPSMQNPLVLEESVPMGKMFDVFREYGAWNKLLDINNVADFNIACQNNKSFMMIKLAEALHEKKIALIADEIAARKDTKIILISGPSSSGKTTFSKRLQIQLLVNGIRPVIISMDNYFVNRVDTPRDENGEWDFEHINTLDLPYFRAQMKDLLAGKKVELPTYSFEKGERIFEGNTLQLEQDNVIILEGLHALNPTLLPDIPREATYKIFVSALTTINIDNHNWIPTIDIRLLRRVVRDYKYRNYSARETIARCPSVMRGEERWIYPFQEEADVMFNSALLFELAVLKKHAEPILAEVPKSCEEYTEAHRLIKFLQYFVAIPEREIPPTSLLREFVGGSSFHY